MVFSEVSFLFFYLVLVLGIYYITPLRFRNGVLLLFNLIFYGWGEPIYLFLMLLTIGINYLAGYFIERLPTRKKPLLIAAVCLNLGLLFFFKYWNFAASLLPFLPQLDIALPIGISFYTFQAMSYTIDVYRADTAAQRSPTAFAAYVTLFPQLIAGPIVRYKDVAAQLQQREHHTQQFAAGVQTFVVGLCKKVLLANNLGQLWDFYRDAPERSALGAWLGILAYTLHIYFDFSGYSDMAIGLGRMFGFEFLPNFNYPYLATSITDFWRRWHMSLSTWFRDYLYIPLGGNRKGLPRQCLNLLLVWTLTGLWHGAAANFMLWGFYFGLILILEKLGLGKLLARLPKLLQHGYALFLIVIGWVLFAAEGEGGVAGYLLSLFQGGAAAVDFYHLRGYAVVLLVSCVAALPVGKNLLAKLKPTARAYVSFFLLVAGLLLATVYLVDAAYNPFLYFRF